MDKMHGYILAFTMMQRSGCGMVLKGTRVNTPAEPRVFPLIDRCSKAQYGSSCG
jgi:hypothetical protein